MKKAILILLCFVILFSTISCNNSSNMNLNNTSDLNADIDLTSTKNSDTNRAESDDGLNKNTSIVKALNDILQKQYSFKEFSTIYPNQEITAQSTIAINVTVPEFENVIFVFSGSLEDHISEYKMVSVNGAGDVLLSQHYGKNFDQIVAEEGERAKYVLSDNMTTYKYEDIYIYRDDFYYYIRGFRHGDELISENIAMILYNENHKRPW